MLSARTPSERGLNELSSPGLLLGQDAVRYDCLIKIAQWTSEERGHRG